MTKDEALRLALEALEIEDLACRYLKEQTPSQIVEAITAIKKTLAQPEQEPVAIIEQLWAIIDDIDTYGDIAKSDDKLYRSMVERRQKERWGTGITTDGYTLNIPTPPQRTWVGLTDEDISNIWHNCKPYYDEDDFARAIEAKLKEKNT